eukprot:1077641_1
MVTLLVGFTFILHGTSSETIWSDSMGDTSTTVDWYHNVSIQMASSRYAEGGQFCADATGPCWSFCGGYIYTTISTQGYKNIKLTFDVDPYAMYSDSGDKCVFSYRGNGNVVWHQFYDIDGSDSHIRSGTFWHALATTTWNSTIDIRIQATQTERSCCFVSNFILEGIRSTNEPSTPPSMSPTETETTTHDESEDVNAIQYDRLDNLAMIHRWAFGGFILGIIVISLSAWMDAKCIPSRKNDYLQITLIVGISLQTMDMLSDCFFAINMGIWSKINPIYVYVLILSVTFVIVPCVFSIGQYVLHSRKHWLHSSDKVQGWLASRSNMLYFTSFITGSSFAAVSLCNSYFFQLDAFDMGLTKKQIQAFAYKRVYSVVLLENIPQLVLQSYFVYSLGSLDDLVTLTSILFSLLSIIVSVLSMFTQRSISRGQGTVSISVAVTGPAVMKKASNCKRMKNALIKELSILVGVSRSITDILKPVPIKQGFEITVQFTVTDSDQDFYRTLMEVQAKGELQHIFKRAWDLSDLPTVGHLKQTVVQSKRERLDSESLSEGKGTTTEKKTDAGQTDVVNEMMEQI